MSEEMSVVVPSVSVESDSPGIPLIQYDRDAMLRIYQDSPESKKRPSFLSEEFDKNISTSENENGDGPTKVWSPDLWIESIWKRENLNSANGGNLKSHRGGGGGGQRSTTSNDGSNSQRNRRQGGTVDRLKAENKDGIVLSPQRRSFGAGCQVPPAVSTSSSSASGPASSAANGNTNLSSGGQGGGGGYSSQRRSLSPRGGAESDINGSQSKPQQINNRNNLVSNKPRASNIGASSSSFTNSGLARGGGGGYQSSRVDRVENWRDRNSHNQMNDGKDYRRQDRRWINGGDRYNNRNSGGEADLPEWATDGPSDMHDTIELHGFDDDFEEHADSSRSQNRRSTDKSLPSPKQKSDSDGRSEHEPVSMFDKFGGGNVAGPEKAPKEIPSSSRFSKFFSKGSADNNNNNKRPVEMSDAAKERKAATNAEATNNLIEMLAHATQAKEKSEKASTSGKVPAGAMNLKDLEAMLCQNTAGSNEKKEMSPTSDGHGQSGAPMPDLSGAQLLQSLFKTASFGQSHQQQPLQQQVSSDAFDASNALATGMRAANKSQLAKGNPLADPNQQQHLMDALQKLHVQRQTSDTSTPESLMASQLAAQHAQMAWGGPSVAAAGIHGNKQQQPPMVHPALLQAMFAEKFTAGVSSENLMANLLQQHKNAFATSPQPHHQPPSTVSQQDLILNTQLAYQKAMINRKLEEQKENFAKRQQFGGQGNTAAFGGGGHQQMSNGEASASTTLPGKSAYSAFLPTSVLKQMHGVAPTGKAQASGKEMDGAKQPQQHNIPQLVTSNEARPIVKQAMGGGSPSGMVPPQPQANTHDVIRFMHQQQQAAQQMQMLRLQQLQMLQQFGGGGVVPRMANNNKTLSNEEYQQMVTMALLQQQQQQFRTATATPTIPAAVDLIRQRALFVAAANAAQQQQQHHSQLSPQQQQQQMLNSFRQQNFVNQQQQSGGQAAQHQQQPMSGDNFRNLFNVGNFPSSSSSVVFPPMPVGNAKPMTLDEIERQQKMASNVNVGQH